MQDGKEKSTRSQQGRVRTGSGIRAKNHTIILNSETTGGVRARLGGAQSVAATGRIGGLEEPDLSLDPSWESPKVSSEMLVTKAHEQDPQAQESEDTWEVNEEPLDGGTSEPRNATESETYQIAEEQIVADTVELEVSQSDLLDPLGLFDDEPSSETHDAGSQPSEAVMELVEPEISAHPANYETEFRPDPLPRAVRVEEEYMAAGTESRREEIAWKAVTPLVGFLVSFDFDENGSYLELRTGRLIVTSQREGSGSCLVLHDQSVSPSHAVMRVASDGTVQVLDQLSESGTRVRRCETGEELLLSGEKTTLSHGDIISFGDRSFHVCLVMFGGAS